MISPALIAAAGNDPPPVVPPVTDGLFMYFPAEYQKTQYAAGAAITTLHDRSGNGHHATGASGLEPVMRHSGGYGGAPYLDVVATGYYFSLPDAAYAGLTAIEMFATYRPKNNLRGPYNQDGLGTDQYYPFDNGFCYSNFHRTDRPSFPNPLDPMTVWQRIGIWSTSAGGADSWCWRTNEVPRLTTSSTFTIGTDGGRWLGTRVSAGHPNGNEWGCVLFYNRRLTTTEREDTDAWITEYPAGGVALAA